MTEEEKQAAATAEAEAKAQAEAEKAKADAEQAGLTDEEKAQQEAKNLENQDYEARLKAEREAREKAEKALADKRFKEDEAKRRGESHQDDDEDKPLTRKELQEVLAKERQDSRRLLEATRFEAVAKTLATSDAEAQAIMEVHRNRVFPAHLTIEQQVEESFAIVNSKKLISERNEALRALKNKDTVIKNPASTHQDGMQTPTKISPQDTQTAKLAGLTWNATSKRFEKKLPNGSMIYQDPQSKKIVHQPR
jgi:hypothetical protein